MLHPGADKLSNILMSFLLEGGDKIIEVKTPASACVQHMFEGSVKNVRAIAVLQSVEEQETLGTCDGVRFYRPRIALRGNRSEDSANDFRADLRTLNRLASARSSECWERGKGRSLIVKTRITPIAKPTGRQGRSGGSSNFGSPARQVDHDRIR